MQEKSKKSSNENMSRRNYEFGDKYRGSRKVLQSALIIHTIKW